MRFLFVIFSVVYVASAECPSGTCDSSQTCCDGPSPGTYGCCPQPNAVCCSDGLHCCPQDTLCDLSEGRCEKSTRNLIPFLVRDPPAVKIQASVMDKANEVGVIYCPGGMYYCQDGFTCCPALNGQYFCCPYPSASCCADRIHCCPYGTRCDTTSRYCLHSEGRYQALMKSPAFPVK